MKIEQTVSVITACLFLNFSSVIYASVEFTNLHSFDGTNGANPVAGLIQAKDGNLYGTASSGGLNYKSPPDYGNGTVFSISPSGVIKHLVYFNGTNGSFPSASLTEGKDGFLYGTTRLGGKYGKGTIFKLTTNGQLNTLFSFGGINGENPEEAMIQTADGNFYGTAVRGGSNDSGVVFKLNKDGQFISAFPLGEGRCPLKLIEGKDGYFYGTTATGGRSQQGTIFQMSKAGAFKTIVSFDGKNGDCPGASLIQGKDGNLYGTTGRGGAKNGGTVFKIFHNGQLTTLLSCDSSEFALPEAALAFPEGLSQESDGSLLFHAHSAEGDKILRLTTNGLLSSVFTIGLKTNGFGIGGRLCVGKDGAIYGVLGYGNVHNQGSVFRIKIGK